MKNNDDSVNFAKSVSYGHLSANGWDLKGFNHLTPFDCHVAYVNDLRFSSLQLFTIRQTDFDSLKLIENVSCEILAGELASILHDVHVQRTSAESDPRLAPSIVNYIKRCETYRIWQSKAAASERMHLVLNVYAIPGDLAMVRPVIISSSYLYIHPTEILQVSSQAEAIDRQRHPDICPRRNC
ncbi:MAG: hypothetical protein EOO52_13185 [Gammaproteobacteria bacterium]|nr:MAG: hypothetical protein EOO52_13185 [Gammaproteobacteria bacterium]